MRNVCASIAVLGVLALLNAGCLDRDLKPLNPCTRSGVVENVRVTSVDKVDLLFMVDNSNSMDEEQRSLGEQFPRLVRVLATGDRNPAVDADGDGDPDNVGDDFPAVRDLQIGVISSDMGTGGFRVPTCSESNFGDNGVLRTSGNTAIMGCSATYPSFLRFRPADGGSADQFAMDVSCVARLGTGGCGFEQQLEATLKAITDPACTEPYCTFNMGTKGHAGPGGSNDGFVRPDSLLALVLVTDEEDCSALNPELFNPMSSVYTGDLNLRCFSYTEAVHPITRYVDGFLASRIAPDLLVYAVIAGVPPALTTDTASYQQILDAPEMQERIDPTMMTRLAPSCNVEGLGVAFPPRRLVQVAQQLDQRGSNGIVQSICQSDFTPALDAIIAKIADVLGGTCLPRALNPDETGFVGCEVIETLPLMGEFTRCDQINGREQLAGLDGTAPNGAQVCRVTQRPAVGGVAPTEPGWYYDNFSPDVQTRCGNPTTGSTGQRISFVGGSEPVTGTAVRLECLQPVQSSRGPNTFDIDSACMPGTDVDCPIGGTVRDFQCPPDYGLVCDGTLRTWQQICNTDADCQPGWRCDLTRIDEGRGAMRICRNPTCG
jgi:hypothetical protein